MPHPDPTLYLDLVDPGSMVMLLRVRRVMAGSERELTVHPFEIRPPPEPLLDPDDPAWLAYWNEMVPHLEGLDVTPSRPRLVPWTRKAHELVLESRAAGCDVDAPEALLRRFLETGADLGRVDVLLPLAREWGLDLTRTKATLDVDRHAGAVDAVRRQALDAGVRGVPTLALGADLLEGIHDDDDIRRFLGA
jgi:2-hydroxychromene-2-carboxylate isomerase